MNIEQFLMLLSGITWSIVYIDGIRIGFKDRSYAIPFWALALNVAWEFLHAALGFREVGMTLQIAIIGIWFLLDIGILITYFRFGKRYPPFDIKPAWFTLWAILGLMTAFILQYAIINEFGLLMGAVYSAFLQNLLMSILFIAMLVQRKSGEGQTMLIAVSKWIGTVAPTILMGVEGIQSVLVPNSLVLVVGILISIFDLVYILLLFKVKKAKKNT